MPVAVPLPMENNKQEVLGVDVGESGNDPNYLDFYTRNDFDKRVIGGESFRFRFVPHSLEHNEKDKSMLEYARISNAFAEILDFLVTHRTRLQMKTLVFQLCTPFETDRITTRVLGTLGLNTNATANQNAQLETLRTEFRSYLTKGRPKLDVQVTDAAATLFQLSLQQLLVIARLYAPLERNVAPRNPDPSLPVDDVRPLNVYYPLEFEKEITDGMYPNGSAFYRAFDIQNVLPLKSLEKGGRATANVIIYFLKDPKGKDLNAINKYLAYVSTALQALSQRIVDIPVLTLVTSSAARGEALASSFDSFKSEVKAIPFVTVHTLVLSVYESPATSLAPVAQAELRKEKVKEVPTRVVYRPIGLLDDITDNKEGWKNVIALTPGATPVRRVATLTSFDRIDLVIHFDVMKIPALNSDEIQVVVSQIIYDDIRDESKIKIDTVHMLSSNKAILQTLKGLAKVPQLLEDYAVSSIRVYSWDTQTRAVSLYSH